MTGHFALFCCEDCGWTFGPNHGDESLKKCQKQAVPVVAVPCNTLATARGELRTAAEGLHDVATGLPEDAIERRITRNIALDLQQLADEITDTLGDGEPYEAAS